MKLTSPLADGAYTEGWPPAIDLDTMPDAPAIVFVVDDDVSVRDSLELLIRTAVSYTHLTLPTILRV